MTTDSAAGLPPKVINRGGSKAAEPQPEMTGDEKFEYVAAKILREYTAAFGEPAKF